MSADGDVVSLPPRPRQRSLQTHVAHNTIVATERWQQPVPDVQYAEEHRRLLQDGNILRLLELVDAVVTS